MGYYGSTLPALDSLGMLDIAHQHSYSSAGLLSGGGTPGDGPVRTAATGESARTSERSFSYHTSNFTSSATSSSADSWLDDV